MKRIVMGYELGLGEGGVAALRVLELLPVVWSVPRILELLPARGFNGSVNISESCNF